MILGLSTTAIGMRSIEEVIAIYRELQPKLKLEYLELAVGTQNDLSQIPTDIPLVIHDRALYVSGRRLPFSLMDESTWPAYREQLTNRNVLGLSIHAPLRTDATIDHIIPQCRRLEEFLEIPVAVELMPLLNYNLSTMEDIPKSLPILVDVSHVNIWANGDPDRQRTMVEAAIQASGNVPMIHLSHNRGQRDSHDLIPMDAWFLNHDWGDRLVTYESLPVDYAQFERKDKRPKNGNRA